MRIAGIPLPMLKQENQLLLFIVKRIRNKLNITQSIAPCYQPRCINLVLLFAVSQPLSFCPDFLDDVEHLGGCVLHQQSDELNLLAKILTNKNSEFLTSCTQLHTICLSNRFIVWEQLNPQTSIITG